MPQYQSTLEIRDNRHLWSKLKTCTFSGWVLYKYIVVLLLLSFLCSVAIVIYADEDESLEELDADGDVVVEEVRDPFNKAQMAEYAKRNRKKKLREISDRSIAHTIMGPVIVFPNNNGYFLDNANSRNQNAKDIATSLVSDMLSNSDKKPSNNSAKSYSLYERFGPDIHFYRYIGEATYNMTAVDHVFSAYNQDKLDKLDLGNTIFYQSGSYLSCSVYKDRPPVLAALDLKNGKSDPRVLTRTIGSSFYGIDFIKGEYYLNASKYITSLVSFLMTDAPIKTASNLIETHIFNKTIWDVIAVPIIVFLMAFATIGVMFNLMGKIKKYTIGNVSASILVRKFLMMVVCYAIIIGTITNPNAMNKLALQSLTFVDRFVSSTVSATMADNDIVRAKDSSNVVEALLWRTNIFQPWCLAMFGNRYEKLYTQYAVDLKEDESKMEQSYISDENIKDIPDDEFRFNSAKYTGDIAVPLGDKEVKNWAAFLYSCQSKNHIDYDYVKAMPTTKNESDADTTTNNTSLHYPYRYTTAYDDSIPADAFRVIDACMDISPQIYNDNTTNANYTNAKMLQHRMTEQGRNMLIYSIILVLSFGPAIYVKLSNAIYLIFSLVMLLFNSMLDLAKDTGIQNGIDNIKQYILNYITASIRLAVLLSFFVTFVNKSLIFNIFYIILAFVVYNTNFKKVSNSISSAARSTKHAIDGMRRKI